jgi:Protein of unknown function (DUF4239)
MNIYWIYDLSNAAFFLLTVGLFMSISLIGVKFFNERLEAFFNLKPDDNQTIGIFLSLSGVFYGITLGLIAVGTFENFQEVESVVSKEASAINSLYRNCSMVNSKEATDLKALVKEYTQNIVNEAWPSQRKGILPKGASKIVNKFQAKLLEIHPNNARDLLLYEKILDELNNVNNMRRQRLNVVTSGLPSTVWMVVFFGAIINIFLTWLLIIPNNRLDIIINALSGALLGSLIFLIAAMDNPFRGEVSVSPEPYLLLLEGIMK